MNTEQLSKLNPEEKRVAIAEACRWTGLRVCGKWRKLRGRLPGYPNGGLCKPPDYLNDLNAMAEVEATLTDRQWLAYQEALHQTSPPDPSFSVKHYIHATAAQRADAFLLCLP